MAVGAGDLILNGAILGLLIGIIWSLRYIVVIDRKMSKLDEKIEHLLENEIEREKKIEKALMSKKRK